MCACVCVCVCCRASTLCVCYLCSVDTVIHTHTYRHKRVSKIEKETYVLILTHWGNKLMPFEIHIFLTCISWKYEVIVLFYTSCFCVHMLERERWQWLCFIYFYLKQVKYTWNNDFQINIYIFTDCTAIQYIVISTYALCVTNVWGF